MVRGSFVALLMATLLAGSPASAGEPLFNGEQSLRGKLPDWRHGRNNVPESVKKAMSRCRPRSLACLDKLPDRVILEAKAQLDEWESDFELLKVPMDQLGIALLGGRQKLSPLPTMGYVRYQLVRIRLAVRSGSHEEAVGRIKTLVAFFNGPTLDSTATPTMIIAMVWSSTLTDLVATVHAAVSCKQDSGESRRPYWLALTALRMPTLDGEKIARGEVAALLKAMPDAAGVLAPDGGIPTTYGAAETAVVKLRQEVADSGHLPTERHLWRAMYLGIAAAGLAQMKLMSLPMIEVANAADLMEREIQSHCPNRSRFELAASVARAIFSGKKPHEAGSFAQFGLDLMWHTSRCGAFSNMTLYWQRAGEMLTKTRGLRILALADAQGIVVDGKRELAQLFLEQGVDIPTAEYADALTGAEFQATTCSGSECPFGFQLKSAGVDGEFETQDDIKITGECGT
jgi:hypothetical protein